MGDEAHDRLYSRVEYRRVIAWKERIRREAPFLEGVFRDAPLRKMLDVGCASGEHTRHFAERGWQAVGVDVSERMMEEAVQLAGPTEAGGEARFEMLGAAEAASLPEAPFGGAICLGNTLAFVEGDAEMDAFLHGVSGALAPGATLLIQMLNYERILAAPPGALPVNVRPLPDDEENGAIVFLRLLKPRPDGDVDFYPVTLEIRYGEEPEIEVRQAKSFVHHAWTRKRLEPGLQRAGFTRCEARGGLSEAAFSPDSSHDLVLLAVKGSAA